MGVLPKGHSIRYYGSDFIPTEFIAAFQFGKFYKEGYCDDLTADFFDELAGGGHCSAGRQQIIDH